MSEPKVIRVDNDLHEISCDGGGTSGHPAVYYTFEDRKELTCEYCGTIFTKKNRKDAVRAA